MIEKNQNSFFKPEELPQDYVLSPEDIQDRKLIMAISDVLNEFMEITGSTLTDISRATGVALSTIADWVNGKREGDLRSFQSSIRLDWRIFAVMAFIGCDLQTLVYGIGDLPEGKSELFKKYLNQMENDFYRRFFRTRRGQMNEKEHEEAEKLGIIKKLMVVA